MNYWGVLLNSRPFHPISTILIKLVDSLISAETNADEKYKNRIEWIYNNTHENLNVALPIVELAVFKNIDRGLSREISFGDKDYHMIDLYKILDEVTRELSTIVIEIAKKYSIDIPMSAYGSNKTMQTMDFSDNK